MTSGQAAFGLLMLAIGLIVLGVAAWENSGNLPFGMPRIWRGQRNLWVMLGFASIVFGLFAVIRGPRESDASTWTKRWRPTHPGQRFHSVVLLTRDGCHLCDEALALLQSYAELLPPITVVNVDADVRLSERFGAWVPVVEFDGKIRFKGRVSEVLLRRLIEGTPPVETIVSDGAVSP